MRKNTTSIPVNKMADDFSGGVAIERLVIGDLRRGDKDTLNIFEASKQPHREDRHAFHLLEQGVVSIEIDFKKYKIKSPSVIYLHPNQVHRIMAFEKVTVGSWGINSESLHPEYLALLESITPVKPLLLKKETFSIISAAVSLCIKFSERKNDKLYHSLLKDSCNTLVALVLSQYLAQSGPADKLSRFDIIAKAFREILERNYATDKRPAAYAGKLNISAPYLNECVKNATGYAVSHHIQQRVVLEAKRLLYHSGKSVKEIATVLGYDDYPYFSRLFKKVTGMTPLTFRNQNFD